MKTRDLSRIRLLMITSHLLLAAFVVYWLFDRFKQEKQLLARDLHAGFQLAEQMTLDSMLMNRVIDPFLQTQDSAKWFPRWDMPVPSQENEVIARSTQINTRERITGKFMIRDSVGDTTPHQVNVFYRTLLPEGSRKKIILQGVKLLATVVRDSAEVENTDILTMAPGLDTSLMKRLFNERLATNRFTTSWSVLRSDDTTLINGNRLVFTSGLFSPGINVEVRHYGLYLFQKLIPNLVFALILLSLTGAAFVISYRSLKKQKLLASLRNEFAGNMAHELKTPVATVKVALEAIRNFRVKEDTQQTEEYLGIATHETDRLEQLIGRVLASFVHTEKSGWIVPERIDLRELLQEVITTLGLRLKQEEAEIQTDSKGADFTVMADRIHIQGVLLNLIDNSLKYTDKKARISILLDATSPGQRVHISDNGNGIPGMYLDSVFDRFFRVPAENIHNIKGYGLGLSYVHAVMQQHGGSVHVRNNPGGGCTFTLIFPGRNI